tara:strand:+ start:358 stop:477 length:120 start_codon:yes stop_codon:yes gene_type:complete
MNFGVKKIIIKNEDIPARAERKVIYWRIFKKPNELTNKS